MKRRRAQNRFYSCPSCQAGLNPDNTIMLVGEHGGSRSLVGFHPEPGNYRVFTPPGFEVQPGDAWEFRCPVCDEDLKTKQNEKLCAIKMLVGDAPFLVLFSRVAGEKATFVMSSEGVQEQHGADAGAYLKHLVQMKYWL